MSTESNENLVRLMTGWIASNSPNPDAVNGKIDKNTNLLEAEILDSIGFIDLISFLEARTGRQVDLVEMEPEDFTTIAGLCRCVSDSAD